MITKKWQPYPTYKDSGVEWLGKIPEHWEVKKLKYISYLTMGQSPSSDDYNHEGYGSPFLQGNAEFGNRHPQAKIFCATVNKYAEKGDILISVRAPVGALNEADTRYGIGRGLCSIRPRDIIIRQFAWYLIQVVKVELNFLSTGSTYEAVAVTDISNLSCLLPPLHEQQKIAEFLDEETSKIDKLITKKERLIELLKEKRTALISHAVTKGLNPDVPMKDSGVEWLGEIPEHWEVKKLKYISYLTMGQSPSSDDYNHEGYGSPFLQGNAEFGNRNPEAKIFCATVNKYAEKGDILISVRAPVGALNEADRRYGIGRGLCSIRPRDIIIREFAWYLIQVVKVELNFLSTGSTYEAVAVTDVSNLSCLLPPLPEQQKIAQFLDRETSKIDNLITKTRTSIDHLKEYRTALISAAVTGKIDVREH
ncbi:MAG: restriction endonuclease subunit S [Microcystis sp. M015S2]|uniref:restriction endonuclease subunit S n=1 Tax=unclassified Microcystis TaxID=2643300 RepID=UPI00258D6B86|nr:MULTISPECIES: restriction endonuclease subunit S [unclassified Microcystis]MCA2711905.1 restriction endonuclease subunit S [Microcystis sp. M025S2]MCA2744152.1 restriction endonuclease subunit S [Microcystis sp. M015S2]